MDDKQLNISEEVVISQASTDDKKSTKAKNGKSVKNFLIGLLTGVLVSFVIVGLCIAGLLSIVKKYISQN